MKESPNDAQVRLNRVSPSYWRVVLNNPPLNLMGPADPWRACLA